MTEWRREYWHRLFVGRRNRPIPGQRCVLEEHDFGLAVGWPAQHGPYTVIVKHGDVEVELVEDTYRESFALDELIAEWLDHEHETACICDDGLPSWCPRHGTLWYDFEGSQYQVERDGWPDPPERQATAEQVVEGWFEA